MSRHALPATLPKGERVLWQGAPDWRGLARDALHLRGLSLYCGALVAYVAVAAVARGEPLAAAALDTARAAGAAAVPLLVGLAYAWFAARAAFYTITDRRIVIRTGAALPMTLNLPFARIDGAALRARSGDLGEIRLKLARREHVSSIALWPHANIWRGQPVLRALPDAERAGQVLARALAASVDAPAPVASPLAQSAQNVETGGHAHGATVAA